MQEPTVTIHQVASQEQPLNEPELDWVEETRAIFGLQGMPHIFLKDRDRLPESSELPQPQDAK